MANDGVTASWVVTSRLKYDDKYQFTKLSKPYVHASVHIAFFRSLQVQKDDFALVIRGYCN